MRTKTEINEAQRLVKNLTEGAETLSAELDKVTMTLRALHMNEQVREAHGLEIGDFFLDRNGYVGVFCGCWNLNMWGRLLDTRHYGYVYPEKRLTHEEAMVLLRKEE